MKIEVGKRYNIDYAPLIASPQRQHKTWVGKVITVTDRQAYVVPEEGKSSALYVNLSWFVGEAKE